ncbi:Rv2175c family DNA-binding protein [Corynebacterium sp.]|uniref:Rv2175c family DNA-binding protein n=1 Tax=Corynebacterium sp. TaxID=1720 RepID=UPI0026DDB065|nr:Rv2175c family DNA-binding protein [Corynebacterium sp.]MDO5075946.1 Rv2175c family DNA-binding protein [Corynebacterium sp.]
MHKVLPADEPVVTIPDAAAQMGVVVTRVFHLINDHQIIPVLRDGIKLLPQAYFNQRGELLKFVPGVIALLSDGGFSDEEILSYLFTADDSLPGRPIDALHGHLAREVMRRAQAMAL